MSPVSSRTAPSRSSTRSASRTRSLAKVHERPRILRQDLLRPRRRRLRGAPRPADRGHRPGLHRVRPRGPVSRGCAGTAADTTPSSSPTRADSTTSGSSPGSSTAATSGSTSSSTRSTLLDGLCDRPQQLVVSTSCSLLHTPIDLDTEPTGGRRLDDELRSWMAFAVQKVGEVATLAKGMGEGREAIADELDANDRARDFRRESRRTRNPEVRARIESLDDEHDALEPLRGQRREAQRARLDMPSSSRRRRSAPIRRRTRFARRARS